MTVDRTPRVGFGDPEHPERFVHFHVQLGEEGEYNDWEPEPNRTVRQIAGSNSFDVYAGGFGPSRMTLEIWCDSAADYRRLRALYLLNRPATLSLLAGFTSHEGIVRNHDGVTYEQFRDTFIDEISRPRFAPDGTVECDITFMRAEGTPSW